MPLQSYIRGRAVWRLYASEQQNKLGTAISDSGTGAPRRRQQIGSGSGVPPGLYDDVPRAAPSVPLWGPAAMPSANEPVWYTASLNLMFRKAPDLTSGIVPNGNGLRMGVVVENGSLK
jgi:hypothetical protein